MLFPPNLNTDDVELERLLASARVKEFLESLWSRYSRFVLQKKEFISLLPTQPFTRIWEIYLGCALVECGLCLEPKGQAGPDIKLNPPVQAGPDIKLNPPVWVEAVPSTDGNDKRHKDEIQPASRTPEVLLPPVSGGPPEDEIVKRCATAISNKRDKYQHYLGKLTVRKDEPYVVGLNLYKTSFSQYDHQHTPEHLPLIVKVLFGYGRAVMLQRVQVQTHLASLPSNQIDYEYRDWIDGSVPTDIFLRDEYSCISALIVSRQGFLDWQQRIPKSLAGSFTVVHNPLATNRLDQGWLKNGCEIWIENERLHKRIWMLGNEHQVETFPLPYDLPPHKRAQLHLQRKQFGQAESQ